MECPKCGSSNVLIQREQTAQVGVGSNKVVVEQNPKKSKGCFYWLVIGFWWEPIKWIMFGWLKPLFRRKTKSGMNVHASKTFNKTVAVCQDCGHSWKVK